MREIAEFFSISSLVVRLIFVFTLPASFWVYLFLCFGMPENRYFEWLSNFERRGISSKLQFGSSSFMRLFMNRSSAISIFKN